MAADAGLGLLLDRRVPSARRPAPKTLIFDAAIQLHRPEAGVRAWLVRARDRGALPERVCSSGFGLQIRLMDRFYLPEIGDVAVTRAMFDLIADLYDDLTRRDVNLAMAGHLLREVIEAGPPSPLILDFGCGAGIAVEALTHLGTQASLLGVDLSEAMLRRASARGEAVMTVDQWRSDPILIDGAIAAFVLHYGVPASDLCHLARSLRPGCRFAANLFKGSRAEMDRVAAILAKEGLTLASSTEIGGTRAPNPVLVFEKSAS